MCNWNHRKKRESEERRREEGKRWVGEEAEWEREQERDREPE